MSLRKARIRIGFKPFFPDARRCLGVISGINRILKEAEINQLSYFFAGLLRFRIIAISSVFVTFVIFSYCDLRF